MERPLDRRTFVGSALLAGGGLWLGPRAVPATAQSKRIPREAILRDGRFRLGVSAGLPGEREITLWTRVDEIERSGKVILEVARDAGFDRVVHRQAVRAAAVRDFTARATIRSRLLQPGEQYFYRFATRRTSSPVGRFRLARPADSREPVRIGFFSCQDYQAGYYTPLRALAAEEDLDLVVCLGDYIYERTYYDGPAERKDRTGANGDADVQTLSEYRQKYRLYRTDRDLQAMHAAHPFLAVIDDHEVEDNWAGDRPGTATPDAERRVTFAERRRAGLLSFFEYNPRFRLRADPFRTYGSVPMGANAELFLLDTRSYRDDQPCNDEFLAPCADDNAPGRTLLGATQKAWLEQGLRGSRARWKVVGNQVMVMALDTAPGQGANRDGWDGYGAERSEVLRRLLDAGVKDVTFITGDIHTFFAGDVHVDGRVTTPAVATEFVGGSITSEGFEGMFGPGAQVTEPGILANNPHYKYSEQQARGYGVLEARPDELRVVFKGCDTVKTPNSPVRELARFRVAAGTPAVLRA